MSLSGSVLPSNLLGPADNFVLNLSGKNIQGIEGILITEEAGASTLGIDINDDVGTTIILHAQDVLDYSTTDSLHILGSPGDKVQLDSADNWDAGVLQPADSQGQAFTLFTATNGAQLFVETEVQVHVI